METQNPEEQTPDNPTSPAEPSLSDTPPAEPAPAQPLNPDDINPLVPAWQLLQEEISPAVAAATVVFPYAVKNLSRLAAPTVVTAAMVGT